MERNQKPNWVAMHFEFEFVECPWELGKTFHPLYRLFIWTLKCPCSLYNNLFQQESSASTIIHIPLFERKKVNKIGKLKMVQIKKKSITLISVWISITYLHCKFYKRALTFGIFLWWLQLHSLMRRMMVENLLENAVTNEELQIVEVRVRSVL